MLKYCSISISPETSAGMRRFVVGHPPERRSDHGTSRRGVTPREATVAEPPSSILLELLRPAGALGEPEPRQFCVASSRLPCAAACLSFGQSGATFTTRTQ